MAISREEISNIAKNAASKVIESQSKCVSAGMTLLREQEAFRKATPIIFRVNLKGLVSADDLKVPHSELAMDTGAAGKNLIAFALTGTQTGIATYDNSEGGCGLIFGGEHELFKPPLVEKINQLWEKRGPGESSTQSHPSNPGSIITEKHGWTYIKHGVEEIKVKKCEGGFEVQRVLPGPPESQSDFDTAVKTAEEIMGKRS